jgi:glycosyltransferase involved in cell wall biosynthesis
MKIIYDIRILGGNTKTGVYRVSESLVIGMAMRLKNSAIFHPSSNPASAFRYYEENLAPLGAVNGVNRIALFLAPFSGILDRFINRSISHRGLQYRVARKCCFLAILFIDYLCSIIPNGVLLEASIYHSPFCIIPKRVRRRNKIIRFTTVYDLIAITDPDYFEDGLRNGVRSIISSLSSEDYTLCISEATRDILLKHSSCSPERSFVIPLAASDHFYPASNPAENQSTLERYGISEDGYILSLCTFEIRKNLEAVIRAFARLHGDGMIPASTKLVLVGGKGWKTQNLEDALSAATAVRDLIIMPGFVPDEDLATIYSCAKVFVYMSFVEGFGLPPLEAMQCGTPVITSNTSSLPEVVGDAGVMLDPNDHEGLCHAITRFYGDSDYRELMAGKALERSRMFSWEKFIDDTIAAYETAIRRSHLNGEKPVKD